MIVLATTLTAILITSAPKKDWSNDDPNIKYFPFNEDDGMKIATPDGDDTLFYFKLLVNDQLLNCIVQRSNEYAHSIINSSHPHLIQKQHLEFMERYNVSKDQQVLWLDFPHGPPCIVFRSILLVNGSYV